MNNARKTRKAQRTVDRREFCRTLSCAALGGLTVSGLMGKDLNIKNPGGNLGKSAGEKEDKVSNKIKAVTAKVISVKGTCGAGHKVGDITTFTEQGVEGKICIHALYSMLPAVFAMMFEARFPWLENSDKKTHPCTDAANPVVFEIERIRES